MKKIILTSLALSLLASIAGAQPKGMPPAPPQMKEPSEIAKERADMMKSEIALDDKQYKKVLKLFKQDIEYRQSSSPKNMPGGMPPQGGPGMGGPGGGMPPQGGGPGMGSGMMGGPGGGMPPQGGMQPGQRPEGGPAMGPGGDVVTEEYLEKQEKKLRKILTPEQYDAWRSKHPAEHLDLPPLNLE